MKRLRKTSFCGTVNPTAYLTDETGNRRFWTIPVQSIDLNKVFSSDFEWYTQLWRQIYSEYKQNPMGYLLTNEEQNTLNRSNEKYETLLQGEDEFMTVFDTSADYSLWTNRLTAAQIADELNSRFKSLHISSMSVGKILFLALKSEQANSLKEKQFVEEILFFVHHLLKIKHMKLQYCLDYPATDKT